MHLQRSTRHWVIWKLLRLCWPKLFHTEKKNQSCKSWAAALCVAVSSLHELICTSSDDDSVAIMSWPKISAAVDPGDVIWMDGRLVLQERMLGSNCKIGTYARQYCYELEFTQFWARSVRLGSRLLWPRHRPDRTPYSYCTKYKVQPATTEEMPPTITHLDQQRCQPPEYDATTKMLVSDPACSCMALCHSGAA